MRVIDIIGQKFNRLTALERVANDKRGGAKFRFRCDCGNETTIALGKDVRNSKTKSCGCFDREQISERATARNLIHGMTGTPEHRTWRSMLMRCTNQNHSFWKRYGGRGITVCDRWRYGERGKNGFECFYEDMGQRNKGLTLDRINNDGNYEPENCRWADAKTQSNNRSRQERAANI